MSTPDSASFHRLLAWSFGPCVPAWAVLGALVAFAGLDYTAALIGALAVFVLMAGLVFSRLADFERLIRYAEESLVDPDTPPPELTRSATAQRLHILRAKAWILTAAPG